MILATKFHSLDRILETFKYYELPQNKIFKWIEGNIFYTSPNPQANEIIPIIILSIMNPLIHMYLPCPNDITVRYNRTIVTSASITLIPLNITLSNFI